MYKNRPEGLYSAQTRPFDLEPRLSGLAISAPPVTCGIRNSMSLSQMKPTQEMADKIGVSRDHDKAEKTLEENELENDDDDYSAEYSEPAMDDIDLELLERFLRLLEKQTPRSDDVSYDDQPLPKREDNKQPGNASSGMCYILFCLFI